MEVWETLADAVVQTGMIEHGLRAGDFEGHLRASRFYKWMLDSEPRHVLRTVHKFGERIVIIGPDPVDE